MQTPSLELFWLLAVCPSVCLLSSDVKCPSARLCHDTDGGSGMAVVVVVVVLVVGGDFFLFCGPFFLFLWMDDEDSCNL